jgi:hypothetical protein
MLPQLSRRLIAKWPDLAIGPRRPDRLHFLGVRTGVEDGYALFLAFADHNREPCLSVKIARDPSAGARLEREWSVLNELRGRKLPGTTFSLPTPLSREIIDEACVLVTTAPPGQQLWSRHGSRIEHFSQVGDWLVQLACATHTVRPLVEVKRDLQRLTERLSVTFEISDQEMRVIQDWLDQQLKASRDDKVELFASHGNLHPGNIWRQHGQLTVVNWEQSSLAWLPLQDLFAFVTTYDLPLTRRRPKDTYLSIFRATYLVDTPYAELVRQTLFSYCAALDIPIESVEACFGIFLAQAALREYDQLLVAAEHGYLPLLGGNKLAGSIQPSYRQAIKDQLWISLLRLLIKERAQFRSATYRDTTRKFQPALEEQRLLSGRGKAFG